MKEIKIENKRQLINILKDIEHRAVSVYLGPGDNTYQAYRVFMESISTLITVLKESK